MAVTHACMSVDVEPHLVFAILVPPSVHCGVGGANNHAPPPFKPQG